MNNFVLSAHAVLPMFLIMAVGYLIKCTGLMDRSDVRRHNQGVRLEHGHEFHSNYGFSRATRKHDGSESSSGSLVRLPIK